ncbi:MAG TPA: IS5/IS1182 family transposase, partial [Ktedonobacteraceae bacterium]|nr:IS5/IS1182 family transposase [Ktedonobacteraceae bacterium]
NSLGRATSGLIRYYTHAKEGMVHLLCCLIKQFRRVATRYEKRASNYLAMVTLAAILLWL